MCSSSAFIGPEDFLYICPTCISVEEDVRKLRYKMGAGAAVVLCCSVCTFFIEVTLIHRSQYLLSGSAMASSLALQLSPTRERTPSPVPSQLPMMNKNEEIADDEMSVTAVSQAADNPISTAASSKSEEVSASIKNLSLDDDVAMRVENKASFVGFV